MRASVRRRGVRRTKSLLMLGWVTAAILSRRNGRATGRENMACAAAHGPGKSHPPSVGHAGERFILKFRCREIRHPEIRRVRWIRIGETSDPGVA